MADFELSQPGFGAVFPDGATESSWQSVGPLITPEEVKEEHLWGIPLVSKVVDRDTGRPDRITMPLLKKFIFRAVSLAEGELGTGIHLFPRRVQERQPYDQEAMTSFGYFLLNTRPCQRIERLSIESTDRSEIYVVPNDWIEKGYLHTGQVHIIPFVIGARSGNVVPVVGPSNAGLVPSLFRFTWVPAMWTVTYITGYPDGKLPNIANELVGTIAAMEVLSMLAATGANVTSASLGIDGVSESQSTPGPEVFRIRMQELADKRRWIIKKIRASLKQTLVADNV